MSGEHKRYSVGFLIDSESRNGDRRVLLIRKNKPEWQAGLLNGVGGHVEGEESADDAMIREFYEEAGLTGLIWENIATITGGATVFVYRCFASPAILDSAVSRTVEKLELHHLDQLYYGECVDSLSWLIPLAANADLDAPVQARGAR